MSAPATYPVWMNKTGAQDMLVLDIGGYNSAIQQGYSLPPNTPTAVASATESVVETTVSVSQPDPAEPTQIP